MNVMTPLEQRVVIKAAFDTLKVYRGIYNENYHSSVIDMCQTGQFTNIEVYGVTNFEPRHKEEIEQVFPKIKVNVSYVI
jgi:hypothetical protein